MSKIRPCGVYVVAFLPPRRGLLISQLLPAAYVVGCILSLLRGWKRVLSTRKSPAVFFSWEPVFEPARRAAPARPKGVPRVVHSFHSNWNGSRFLAAPELLL